MWYVTKKRYQRLEEQNAVLAERCEQYAISKYTDERMLVLAVVAFVAASVLALITLFNCAA